MATAEEEHFEGDDLLKRLFIHSGGVGGGIAVIIYIQSWYTEPLEDNPVLLAVGLNFWMVTIGALSWTIGEFIAPSFLSART